MNAQTDSILYVIDGYLVIPKASNADKSIINLINPNDIETLTIYKDQDSLQIFGHKFSKNKSGAIVIQTKNPEKYRQLLREFSEAEEVEMQDSIVFERNLNPSFYINRGVEKFDKGNYRGAIADYDSAIFLNEDNPNYFINRGLAKEKLQDFKGAMQDYQRAIHSQADYAKSYTCIATLYFKQKQYKDAVHFYSQAIELESDDGLSYYNRGIAYYRLQKLNECCIDLKKASELGIDLAERARRTYCK